MTSYIFHPRVIGALVVAGTLASVMGAPAAHAAPGMTPAEQRYLADLYQYVHPPVTDARLVELGNLTCSARRGGSSTDDAKVAVWRNLDASGVSTSNAEIGTLVHEAIDYLCPEVGYP